MKGVTLEQLAELFDLSRAVLQQIDAMALQSLAVLLQAVERPRILLKRDRLLKPISSAARQARALHC